MALHTLHLPASLLLQGMTRCATLCVHVSLPVQASCSILPCCCTELAPHLSPKEIAGLFICVGCGTLNLQNRRLSC